MNRIEMKDGKNIAIIFQLKKIHLRPINGFRAFVCVCVCVFYMAFIRTILPEFPLKSDNNDAKSELKTHKHQNEHTTGNRKA